MVVPSGPRLTEFHRSGLILVIHQEVDIDWPPVFHRDIELTPASMLADLLG